MKENKDEFKTPKSKSQYDALAETNISIDNNAAPPNQLNNENKDNKYNVIFDKLLNGMKNKRIRNIAIIIIVPIIIIIFILLIINLNFNKKEKGKEKEIKLLKIVENNNQKTIVGIYFGTSISGYYILNNNNIESNNTGLFPSELILDEDSERGLFYGDKAHNYSKNELLNQKKLYFSQFKKYAEPSNFNNKIKSDVPEGHEVSLEIVISQYLSLLKETNLNNFENITEKGIKWILAVPGFWDERGKQLMLNVTNNIKMIDSEIILQQEAASLSILYDENIDKKHLSKNKAYIVVNAGFSSVDICVNKIIDDKKNIKQLIQPMNFRYGSNIINEKIINVIESVYDKKKIDEVRKKNYDDWQKTLDDIELKKNEINETTNGDINIITPFNSDKWNWLGLQGSWEGKYIDRKITFTRDHISIPSDIIKSFITETSINIINEMQAIFDKMSIIKEKIELIIITGGFSTHKILQNEIKKNFEKSHFISFLKSPLETIMKGAAIYGLNPDKILYRVSPVTIGIGIYINFEENEGKCEKQLKGDDEQFRCFKYITFIEKGKTFQNTQIISKKIKPWEKNKVNIIIYSTFNDILSSNDCKELGEIVFELDGNSLPLENREIEVSFKFSNYITVSVFDKNSKKEKSSKFYYPS